MKAWTDHQTHYDLLGLYVKQIRSEYGQRLYAYEALPRWRRLFARRPKPPTGVYSADIF